jgi:hypothetical protein
MAERGQRIAHIGRLQMLVQLAGKIGRVDVADRRLHRQHDWHPGMQQLLSDARQRGLTHLIAGGPPRAVFARGKAGRAARQHDHRQIGSRRQPLRQQATRRDRVLSTIGRFQQQLARPRVTGQMQDVKAVRF